MDSKSRCFSKYPYLFVILTLVAWPAVGQRNVDFEPACPLPFEAIKKERWIDGYCGPEGSAGTAAGRLQNAAKNNFCAPEPFTELTLANFLSLQKAADNANVWRKPKGIPSPKWRGKLQDIWTAPNGTKVGEGDLVRFIGYVDQAYDAVEDSGESVNCEIPGSDHNDIHLELGETPDPDKCQRLVTEISPHFRPSKWTASRLVQVSQQGTPIRVTGHLFWDASHSPCGSGEPEQWRATTWEIHPIYKIEVCSHTDINNCRTGGATMWVSLEKWGVPWPLDDTEEAAIQDDNPK